MNEWFHVITASTGLNLAHGVYFGQGMCNVSRTVFGLVLTRVFFFFHVVMTMDATLCL